MNCKECNKKVDQVRVYSEAWQYADVDDKGHITDYRPVEEVTDDTLECARRRENIERIPTRQESAPSPEYRPCCWLPRDPCPAGKRIPATIQSRHAFPTDRCRRTL